MSLDIVRTYDLPDDVPSEQFTKIMPAIHSRFTETEAREWRQIYKVSVYKFLSPFSAQDVDIGVRTTRIPDQEWKRDCCRRRSLLHLYREDVEELPLH